ncbi:hypothetical protein QUB47_36520, partial [Microcoleus sp. AT9_B5]
MGKHQWKFECFWLYGAVSIPTGKSFFWEFSHLDKVCFEAYLQLLSIQYPHELHSIQVDNAPAHNLSSSELPDNVREHLTFAVKLEIGVLRQEAGGSRQE